jgi:anti-sigma factor RsiW
MTSFFAKVLRDDSGAATRKSARKPRWLATAGVRHGLLMGIGYWVIAIAALIASFFTAPIVARMFAGLWLVFGVWFLASAAIVRRRGQSAGNTQSPEQPPDLPPSA